MPPSSLPFLPQGRSIGSLQGEFSTPEEKTYPRIAIRGYSGDAIVVVSCVTSEKPYKVSAGAGTISSLPCMSSVYRKTFLRLSKTELNFI